MIRFLLRNSRWVLALSMAAGLVSGLGGVGLIAIVNTALDRPSTGLGWIFIGLCALLLLARASSAILLMRLGQNAVFDLRLALSRTVLSSSLARLQELGPARVLACLVQDVSTLAEAFQWLPMFCVNSAVVAGCLVYLGWLSGLLLALVAATIVLGVGGFRLIERRALRGLGMARECDDALYGHLKSLTQGIKELKLHRPRRDAFLSECLENTAIRYRCHFMAGMGFYILANNWGNGLFYAVIGIVLFVLPELPQIAGALPERFEWALFDSAVWREITPEVLRGYCLTLLYLMSPLTALVDGLPIIGKAGVALRKIQALEGSCAGSEATDSQPSAFTGPPVLKMAGVSHRYYGTERCFTLGPLDLSLHPGELVFLVGGNGSGKTTLALLLVGLYAPESGEIRLGGRRVGDRDRESYRQQFSAVFSDFYLFDSLLGFQNRELDAEARAYLTRLQLDHKVQIEAGAFSTLDLSQGQRKRLALLVAYLEDRPFYVFDEWAADQDPVFKKVFYTEILPALKSRGKTVVAISHDDAYFRVADRCLKLEEGKLREMPVPTEGKEPELLRDIHINADVEVSP